MIVYKKSIINFINAIILKGDIDMHDFVFNITKDCITVCRKSVNNIVALKGNLKIDSDALGEVGISDLSILKDFINAFTDEKIEIEKKDNKFILISKPDKLKIVLPITKPEYIKLTLTDKVFENYKKDLLDNEFTLDQDIIKKIVEYIKTIRAQDVYITGKDKTITLQLSEFEKSINATFALKKEVKPFKLKFKASYLTDFFTSIPNQEVLFSAYTNKFLYAKILNKTYVIEYLLAPIEIKDSK